MAFVIAIYASRSGSPLTMQDSLLAVSQTLPDGIGYPQGHAERFPIVFVLLSQASLGATKLTIIKIVTVTNN